jgi:hypothetical protein
LNVAFTMAILDLISRVHLASLAVMLQKQLKYSTLSDCFLIYHYLYCGWLPWDSHYLSFSTFISIL